MRTFKIFTLGCKVNQYDSQLIRESLIGQGLKEIDNGRPADVYIVNTCTVTARADRDSLYYINRAYRENPKAEIIASGCLVERDEDKIKKAPGAFLIIKKRDKNRAFGSGISFFKGHTRAFLKIQDGCDNFCAYCKVPLVRGVPRSKSLNEIVDEAKQLTENGFKEIVLSGICLGKYGKDLHPRINLVKVIEALENIPGLLRLRLSSIEAKDVSEGLIKKMAESPNFCRHLHIPVQSGDDRILKKMNRAYRRRDYLSLIKKIKSALPGIAITTDCLVGFPGEGEDNFKNTLDLVQKLLPLKVHIFPYSRREGTRAYDFKNDLSREQLNKRIIKLRKVAARCSLKYRRRFIGKNMNVLIEGRAKEKAGFWEGYTDNYIKVIVKSKTDLKNQIICLKLKEIERDADSAAHCCGIKCGFH